MPTPEDSTLSKLYSDVNGQLLLRALSNVLVSAFGEFERYDEILFVGGGIGVTPLHSSFRALYALAKHNPAAMPCARVRLVWCARTPEIFELFAPTFHDAARDDLGGKFGVSLYCDMAPKDGP